LRARAMARRATASSDQIAADLAAGRGVLAEAAAIGRSDPAVHVAQGELEQSALRLEIYGAGEIAAPFDAGIAAADRALAIDPDNLAALTLRVGLRRHVAEYRGNLGQDVTELLTGSVTDARRVVELSPSEPAAKLLLARAYRQWAEFRQGRNEDPRTQLQAALRATDSIAAGGRTYDVHVQVGLIHKVWADYQSDNGKDADDHRTQAIDAYTQALRLDDHRADAWLNLGINYYRRAQQPRGHDAEADLGRALEALERGRVLDPGSYVPYFCEGEVYRMRAERTQARGVDPAPDRARAIELYRKGLTINSQFPLLYNGISMVQVEAARDAFAHGQDPTRLLDQAYDAAARAIQVAPDQAYGYNNLGDVLLRRAAFERARGRDPRPTAREAIQAFTGALDRFPDDPTFLLNLGAIHSLVAAYELDQARDPRDSLALARRNIESALARDATLDRGKRLLAEVDALEARWRAQPGRRSAPASAERPRGAATPP
ncbi:MAG TPA: hypothetical protein VF516_45950, partial [Kofleriaceae bacterium]